MGTQHNKQQSGFTLIEVLIVTTVSAILAAIAIPVYSNYQTRARMAEPVAMAFAAKQAVTEYSVFNGQFPQNNAQAGLPEPDAYATKYVEGVTVQENGVVVVDMQGGGLEGQMLALEPTRIDGSVTWVCWSSLPDSYLPSECRGGGASSGDDGGDDADDADDGSDDVPPRKAAREARNDARDAAQEAKKASKAANKAAKKGDNAGAQEAAAVAQDAADRAKEAAKTAREAADRAAELAESGGKKAIRDAKKADNAAKQAENAAKRAQKFADKAAKKANG